MTKGEDLPDAGKLLFVYETDMRLLFTLLDRILRAGEREDSGVGRVMFSGMAVISVEFRGRPIGVSFVTHPDKSAAVELIGPDNAANAEFAAMLGLTR